MDFCPVADSTEEKPIQTSSSSRSSKEGRWTDQEHALFVKGLLEYGKDWPTISHIIRTRTIVQVRTHAQKYFIKMKKYKESLGITDQKDGEEEPSDEVGPSAVLSNVIVDTLSLTPEKLVAYSSAQQVLYDFLSVPLTISASPEEELPYWFNNGHPLSLLLRNIANLDFATMESMPDPLTSVSPVQTGITTEGPTSSSSASSKTKRSSEENHNTGSELEDEIPEVDIVLQIYEMLSSAGGSDDQLDEEEEEEEEDCIPHTRR